MRRRLLSTRFPGVVAGSVSSVHWPELTQAQARLDNKLAGDDGQIELTDISKASNDKVHRCFCG